MYAAPPLPPRPGQYQGPAQPTVVHFVPPPLPQRPQLPAQYARPIQEYPPPPLPASSPALPPVPPRPSEPTTVDYRQRSFSEPPPPTPPLPRPTLLPPYQPPYQQAPPPKPHHLPPPQPQHPHSPKPPQQSYHDSLHSNDGHVVAEIGSTAGSIARKGTTGLWNGTSKVLKVFKEDAKRNFGSEEEAKPAPLSEEDKRKKKEMEKQEEEYFKETKRKAFEKAQRKQQAQQQDVRNRSASVTVYHEPAQHHTQVSTQQPAAPPLPNRPGQSVCEFRLNGYGLHTHDKETYAMYTIEVRWGSVSWTIYRRYSQFYDMDKTLKRGEFGIHLTMPPKQAFGNLDSAFLKQREEGLKKYLEDITKQQDKILATPKGKKILMRFFAPIQMGDVHPSALPFDVGDILR